MKVSRLLILIVAVWLGTTLSAQSAQADREFSGNIKQVGSASNKEGLKYVLIWLEDQPGITFQMSPEYAVKKGLQKVIDLYNAQAMKATGDALLGAAYADSGFEGRSVQFVGTEVEPGKVSVKSLDWKH